MTTLLAICTDALRESNLIGVNAVPTTPQLDEAVRRLQSLIASVYGFDVGENYQDWMVGLNNVDRTWDMYAQWTETYWRYPIQNARLLLNAPGPQTLYFPRKPDDGARMAIVLEDMDLSVNNVTLSGNGRFIEGATEVVLNDNATAPRSYMYRADLGEWKLMTPLTSASEMPFPIEFDDYFITKLAMRLNPRYGRVMTAETGQRLSEQTQQIKARYRQKQDMPAQLGVLNTSDPGRFDRGFFRGGRGRFGGWMG